MDFFFRGVDIIDTQAVLQLVSVLGSESFQTDTIERLSLCFFGGKLDDEAGKAVNGMLKNKFKNVKDAFVGFGKTEVTDETLVGLVDFFCERESLEKVMTSFFW